MRLKYYTLTLRQMSMKKSFVFFIVLIFLTILTVSLINNKVRPVITTLSEAKSRYIALKCTEEVVSENISNIKYSNLITMEKDANQKVTALNANVMEMNRISNNISKEVQEKLSNASDNKIMVPLGSIIGGGLLGGYGPQVNIKVLPTGNIVAKFKSEFESAGINQTRHRIFLEVTSNVTIVAPFSTSTQSYTTDITVAETVIVSDTPTSYYNITGINDLNSKDSLELIE